MSFMSVLSAIGKGVQKVIGVAAPIMSVVAPLVPGGVMASIAGIIATVERAFEVAGQVKAGQQKFETVLPIASELIRQSELVSGHEVMDEQMFMAGVGDIVNGVVKVLKAIGRK